MKFTCLCIIFNFLVLVVLVTSKKASKDNKPQWAKKDIRDFSEADLERLLDQWDVSCDIPINPIKTE